MRLQGKHILVADDEERIKNLIRIVLEREGASVDLAADGAEAFRLASLGNPDLILMDLNMPGTNGLEAIRSLRLTQPKVRILVLTGYTTPETLDAALEAGADRCLCKPVQMAEMIGTLTELLAEPDAESNETE